MLPEQQDKASLSTLDLVSAWMDSEHRPLSFGQILHLKENAPDAVALMAGAESARKAYAQSGCVLQDETWNWCSTTQRH